ncbi:hypothetical protein D5F01_LYC00286 [Larimichthys crocea]|uniref:Uncharacterized protein n=1 Tax=Larimichthys crocea TaxID=215358 RepID=A0A6G0J8V4_LARCR|nr:hypothetical protein D5F01_LYC00286 [Larimichthys crocea]
MRVRKPSMHFLHAVATSMSRSYSHSNALLRRSKQLLLNKASNERKQAELQSSVQTLVEKRPLCGQEQENISQDLNRVASMSVDSIFTPEETLKWWAASAEENTMNQELARRIRHISDTWVSDTVENQEKEIALNSKLGTKGNRKSKQSSVEPVDVPKEQNLCSKAWSPETLKECRVFLRKINSPDNESTEEEWDSCTVTLDNGSPFCIPLRRKDERTVQEQDEMPAGRQKGKYKSPGVVSTEQPQPPPAKMLRQSRMRGLTGPRWCDFVFEN